MGLVLLHGSGGSGLLLQQVLVLLLVLLLVLVLLLGMQQCCVLLLLLLQGLLLQGLLLLLLLQGLLLLLLLVQLGCRGLLGCRKLLQRTLGLRLLLLLLLLLVKARERRAKVAEQGEAPAARSSRSSGRASLRAARIPCQRCLLHQTRQQMRLCLLLLCWRMRSRGSCWPWQPIERASALLLLLDVHRSLAKAAGHALWEAGWRISLLLLLLLLRCGRPVGVQGQLPAKACGALLVVLLRRCEAEPQA